MILAVLCSTVYVFGVTFEVSPVFIYKGFDDNTSMGLMFQLWVLALLSKGQQSCPSDWGKTIILWVMALRCFWRPERQSHAKQK